MINIKIDGKPHQIPESWDEVSFELYLKLLDAKEDYLSILSLMLDIPENDLKSAKIQGLDIVISSLKFMRTPPEIEPEPKELGKFKFPKDITFETVEQFEDVRREITKVQEQGLKEQAEALAYYCAVYCQEPYDSEQARYLSKSFYSLPCVEVMSAGSFFQAKCLSMQSGLSMNYLRKNIPMKKRKPAFLKFTRRLAFTPLWIVWRGMWAKMTRRS